MISRIFVSALAAAGAASALVARDVCNADNCLRALRATSPQTRLAQAQQDCAAFLAATVNPFAATSTVYLTVSSTTTIVDQVTATETVRGTTTSTVRETPTSTVYTSTTTVTADASTPKKREIAATATIPAYATACSGMVRYTSACSCIGVSTSPSTVTSAATTFFVTESTKALVTVKETAVVTTSRVVVYDETKVVTVTEPAVTVSKVSTTTFTKATVPTAKVEVTPLNTALGIINASLGIALGLRPAGAP